MMLSIIAGPFMLLINYWIWKSIYETTGQALIGGFTFNQMISYLVISVLSGYLIWDNIDAQIARGVRTGDLAIYMLKPLSFIRQEFIAKLGHRTLAAVIEFIPAMIVVGFMLGFDLIITKNFLFFIGAIAIAFVMSFLIRALLGIVSFYVVKPHGIISLYMMISGFLYGIFLPLSIWPAAVQKVFVLLPFQFVSYVPASMFIGDYTLGGISMTPGYVLIYGAIQTIIMYLIVRYAWNKSINKFCGVGT